MKTTDTSKKVWIRPAVHTLSITKDTFGGSGTGGEGALKDGPPAKKSV